MRMLWLKTELLHPVDKGGKIRTYQMLRHIGQSHDVSYLTLVKPDEPAESFARANEYCSELLPIEHPEAEKFSARFYRDLAFNLGSSLPFAVQKYHSETMQAAIAREMNSGRYDLVVCDFLAPSVNLFRQHRVPAVLFQHNVESTIWQRHYETQRHSLKRALFHNQWQKMRRFEREACHRFDAVIAVSAADRDRIRNEFGLRQVFDVPTGVDTDYFRPSDLENDPAELVFTGSMDWLPNEDAVLFFVERVLPQVSRAIPEIKFTVVGRNPSAKLRDLAANDSRITLTGRVDDVRPYVHRASVFVVPLRIGGGTRLKIFEAMAMAKPVISTSIGAEGLPLQPGRDLMIADEPEALASSVIFLLKRSREAKAMGERARALVSERFGWEHAAQCFIDICNNVTQNAMKRRAA